MNLKNTHWQAACAKSLLVVFIAQILLSATCVATAHADVLTQKVATISHCHSKTMSLDMQHADAHKHGMPACSHCDMADMGLSAHVSISVDMTPVLLAIIVLPEPPVLFASARAISIQQRAPPPSSPPLHHTNQRILI